MIVWLVGTIHEEADSIRYVAEFSAEVYKTMSAYVMRNL